MNNKEFLFIYDAALCNPNGDPDQENKPRMDRATKTNLVSDTRLKRYIRDYLIDKGKDIFVSTMNGNKVSVTTRLEFLVNEATSDEPTFLDFVENHKSLKEEFEKLKGVLEEEKAKKAKKNTQNKDESTEALNYFQIYRKISASTDEAKKKLGGVNNEILIGIIKDKLLDIRYFGGAFAVGGFSRTIIGPIQINFGYSLHPVELNDSNSIVTIMGDKEGQSGIGKKETLHYSLIAFTGTINSKKAEIVNLTDSDLEDFRKAIVLSLLDQKSDSKKNQYPRLYLEIEYKANEVYGRLGDLRNLISVKSKVTNERGVLNEKDFSQVRRLEDVSIDFKELKDKIKLIADRIEKIRIWKSLDNSFKDFTVEGFTNIETLDI
jgi:CRISPR-associated protein Csh2